MAILKRRGASEGLRLGDTVVVGRGPSCHLHVADSLLAGEQFVLLRMVDGCYRLDHLGVERPTRVNGKTVESVLLEGGDVIEAGQQQFHFVQEAGEVSESAIDFDDNSAQISLRTHAQRPHESPAATIVASGPDDEIKKLRAAYELSRSIGLQRGVDEVLQHVLDTAFGLFSPDRGAIFLLDADENITYQRARTRKGPAARVRVSRSVVQKALQQRQALISLDAANDERFSTAQSVRLTDVHSIMCVPMIFGDEIVGLIYLDSIMETGLFSEHDLDLLTTFGQQAAVWVKNANLLTDLQQANRELRVAKEAAESANEELRRKNDELERLVVRDPLTRLFNHAFLQDRVEDEIVRGVRHGQAFGLLLLNIDAFRELNDAHGHSVGNQLLCDLADLLRHVGRGSDLGARIEEFGTVTRYDGDTFAVLLPETHKRGASVAAERLRVVVEGYDFGRHGVSRMTVSLGVAAFPDDATQRSDLIRAAETALFAAKQVGGNQVIAYSTSLSSLGEQKNSSELGRIMALDRVIKQSLMRYLYQPIVGSGDRTIFAYEALCRPTDGVFASPVDLLDMAERKGRVQELGVVMRKLAIEPVAHMPEDRLLFMNLHPLELSEDLLGWAETCPWRDKMVLEVTESAEIKEHDRVRDLLKQLKKLGYRIALDDLGAGYSSLNSLALLEPDFVKIDMRLVHDIETDSRSARLIKHILDFSRAEGMKVIAEGIETEQERQVVTDIGCDYLQGFLFSRPEPPFAELI